MEKLNQLVGIIVFAGIVAVFASQSKQQVPEDPWFKQAVLENSRPVVVKFGAEWCGPCRSMDQALNSLESRFSGTARFLRINIDEKPELFASYGSGSGIPQVMIFKNGQVVARDRGFGGTEHLRSWLSKNL